jgi:hypothetical protein
MRRLSLLPSLAGALLALGCTSPDIQPVAGDVYVISATASKYSTGKREDLIRQADAFAERQGKVAVGIPQAGTLTGIDRGGVVEYRFRLVDKGSSAPQAAPPAATAPPKEASAPKAEKPAPVESPAQPLKPVEPSPKEAKPVPAPDKGRDLYSELLKLDDLRKRGILTEEEFQAQKKKLLEGPQK